MILDKLGEDSEIAIGTRKRMTPTEVMRVWGHTGILDRLELMLKDSNDEVVKRIINEAIGYVEKEDGQKFQEWTEKVDDVIKNNSHFRALVLLWDTLTGEDVQPLLLRRRSTMDAIRTKYDLLAQQFVTYQDLIDAIIGSADNPGPKTIRALVKDQLRVGAIRSSFEQAQAQGVPDRAAYATLNAVHCPSFNELGSREWDTWKEEIKVLLEKAAHPYQVTVLSQLAPETRDLNSAYRPTSTADMP